MYLWFLILHPKQTFFLNLLTEIDMKTKTLAINTMALRAGAIIALLISAAAGML
jgi:hypothetical protein